MSDAEATRASDSPFPVIFLKAQQHRRIQKGHLWIYSNEVDTARSPLKQLSAGAVARFCSHSGQGLGLGFVNPQSLICGRILTRDQKATIDSQWLETALRAALSLRERLYSEPYYRLVHGEADYLPGLVIDRYGDVVVVQWSAAGFDTLRDALVSAIERVVNPVGIVIKNDGGVRELEQLAAEVTTLGEVPAELTVIENGCRFAVPSTGGQKTGWFFDHRENRARFAQLARGLRVLDVFCYAGGWGVQAAMAGAASAVCVDSAAPALAEVHTNAERNGVADRVSTRRGRAVEVLKAMAEAGERFDAIAVDPPAFIKRRKDQAAGEAAYRHVTDLALALLAPGGVLMSASCSMPLGEDGLRDIVTASLAKVGRRGQLFARGGQAADHPVHPSIPETNYLKALFFRVLD